MPLTKKERASLTRQLFEAIASVGFLTWKQQEKQHTDSAFAQFTPQQLRNEYFQVFEKTAWAELQEMAAKASDEQLYDTLSEWMDRAKATALMDRQKEKEAQPKQVTKKDLDIDMDR